MPISMVNFKLPIVVIIASFQPIETVPSLLLNPSIPVNLWKLSVCSSYPDFPTRCSLRGLSK